MFDFGSAHTFIAMTFVNRNGLLVYCLGYNLVVSNRGVVLTTGVCVRVVRYGYIPVNHVN